MSKKARTSFPGMPAAADPMARHCMLSTQARAEPSRPPVRRLRSNPYCPMPSESRKTWLYDASCRKRKRKTAPAVFNVDWPCAVKAGAPTARIANPAELPRAGICVTADPNRFPTWRCRRKKPESPPMTLHAEGCQGSGCEGPSARRLVFTAHKPPQAKALPPHARLEKRSPRNIERGAPGSKDGGRRIPGSSSVGSSSSSDNHPLTPGPKGSQEWD